MKDKIVRIYVTDSLEKPLLITDLENFVLPDRQYRLGICHAHDGFFSAKPTTEPLPSGVWVAVLGNGNSNYDTAVPPKIDRLVEMQIDEYEGIITKYEIAQARIPNRLLHALGFGETLDGAILKHIKEKQLF